MGLFDIFKRAKVAPVSTIKNSSIPGATIKVRSGGEYGYGGGLNLSSILGQGMSQGAQTGRLESSWTVTPTTVDAQIYQEWNTLVARSQKAYKDFDHFRKFTGMVVDNVAGPVGFTLNANIKDPSGSVDELASEAIKHAYGIFSSKGNFDVTGQLTRTKLERLAMATWSQTGEFIVMAKRSPKYLHGIAWQVIDPVRLDPLKYQKLSNGNHIRHGIEMDEDGRPVAYYFKDYDEQEYGYIVSYLGQSYTRVPAENVIHWFMPEVANQKRGLPPAAAALWRMRMLSGFEDAAITNARIGAAKMGFFKDPDSADDEEDIQIDAEPGMFENIGNRELQQWSPQFPDQSIEPFMKALLRSIASSLRVSYHNLSNDLTSVNFSSIRQGALDEREAWKGIQTSFVDDVVKPMFEMWLETALLNQKILINGKPLKWERLEKYKAVKFSGRRWAWIDPSAEQTANERAVAQGFKSRSEVIRETSTREPEHVWDEIAAENNALKARGVVPLIPSGSVPPMQAQPDSASLQKIEE